MNFDAMKEATDEHMKNPQPGDIFSEMCSFWVFVLARVGTVVLTVEYGKGEVRAYNTPEEMAARFAYGSIPGYWVTFDRTDLPYVQRIAEAELGAESTAHV
jgi:hypothetical protein